MKAEPHPDPVTCTFTGLYGVDVAGGEDLDLYGGFYLLGKESELAEVLQDPFWFSSVGRSATNKVDCLFCLKNSNRMPMQQEINLFQTGLMALQIVKPSPTIGCILHGHCWRTGRPNINHMERRPEMSPGEWARMRRFDKPLTAQAKALLPEVLARMENGSAEQKNSIVLLQFALEHFHPLVKGLFAVMGLDALFNSKGRNDFKKKLCRFLGESTPAFPDWNSPRVACPRYNVGQVALHLYTLRSKIVHGVDLRKASQDKNIPVDLMKKVELIEQLEPRPYAALLAEAAIYILCLSLKKDLGQAPPSTG